MEESYLDILSKNILNDVKRMVKHNNVILNDEKIMATDKKMLEIIKSVVKDEKDVLFEKTEEEKEKRKEVDSNIMPSLMQYYVAIHNDSLDILHKLLDNGFNWGDYNRGDMNLFVLDKKISSQFKEDEYINIVKNYTEIFKNFYSNLYYSNNQNKVFNQEEIIEKFCNIIKLYSKNNKKEEFTRLFTIDFLNSFTIEEIINLTNEQKFNLDGLTGFKNTNDKVTQLQLDLVKKYNFSKKIIFLNKFSEYFSEEEISNLSQDDIKLFDNIFSSTHNYYDNPKAIEETAVCKLKQIKKENPEFNIRLDGMGYNVLTPKQILSMTDDCADQINLICSQYYLYHSSKSYEFDVSENTLRRWIKERYHKEKIKKILVKRK